MIATLREVTYTYPGAPAPALRGVSLDLAEGAFALLAGPSAGGKSTLLRLFNGLVPQFHGGQLAGHIEVAGLDPARTPARRIATLAGMVFQEPEAQAVAETVEDEIAFGMEQHGIAPDAMRRRLDALLATLGIEHLRHRRLATLSGGERQRAAIAAVLALEPRLLLLDEPTSQLDPAGAASVIAAVEALHRRGLTVLIAEHRLERLLPAVGSVIEVEDGAARQLFPRDAAAALRAVPPVCELSRRIGLAEVPLTVGGARAALGSRALEAKPRAGLPAPGGELLRVTGLTVAYGENVALREASFALHEGEIVALVGANGSGKTTLFRALAGLEQAIGGEVMFRGRPAPARVQERTAFAALVPQDPAIALYHETVAGELAETLKHRRQAGGALGEDLAQSLPRPASERTAMPRVSLARPARTGSLGENLAAWNLAPLAGRNPRDLSVGQQQRVAVASMLAHEPPVWLLDEPTRGADAAAKAWLAGRLREHAAAGGAGIVSTHDVESAARYATRVIGLEQGRVAFDLPARQAFAAGGPLPTQIAQLVPGAITVEDVQC